MLALVLMLLVLWRCRDVAGDLVSVAAYTILSSGGCARIAAGTAGKTAIVGALLLKLALLVLAMAVLTAWR